MSKKLKISGPVGGAGIVISTVDAYQPQPPDHAKPTRQSATSSQGEAIQTEATGGVSRVLPKGKSFGTDVSEIGKSKTVTRSNAYRTP